MRCAGQHSCLNCHEKQGLALLQQKMCNWSTVATSNQKVGVFTAASQGKDMHDGY